MSMCLYEGRRVAIREARVIPKTRTLSPLAIRMEVMRGAVGLTWCEPGLAERSAAAIYRTVFRVLCTPRTSNGPRRR